MFLSAAFDDAVSYEDGISIDDCFIASRLSTAGNEFSPVSIKYFFMGQGPVEHFQVDGCGWSSAFLFKRLQLWSRFRCSYKSSSVEPPVAFRVEVHILYFAE